jgi:tetratricopeptide (TPR) repeat protein
VDARSDLYSIAVMLYQAVVGQVPFSGRSALAVVSLQASAPPPRPSVVSPERDIFPPLENLILRALAKDPAERPSSAEVFRSDLLQIALDYRRRQRPRGAGDRACSRGPAATLPASGAHSGRPSRLGRAAIIAAALGLTFAASLARRWPSESARATQLPSAGPNRAAAGPEISRAPTLPQPGAIATGVPSAATATDDFQRRVGRLKVPGRALRPTLAKSVVTGRGAAEAEQRATLARAILLVRRAEEVLGQGRVGEACAVGLRGAADAPGAAVVWEFLGRCYMRLGQPDEARLYYQKYLAVAPPGTNTTIVRAIVGDDPTSGAR